MDKVFVDLHAKLIEPFPAGAVSWKPQSMNKECTKALAVAYIDARDVMNRLDLLVGMDGWEDKYTDLAGGAVMCKLTLHVTDSNGYRVSISRMDVGGQSDQPDPGDKKKAAFSDALKRAAVKFGIGRYLYGLENRWYEINTYKGGDGKLRFDSWKVEPRLPPWALPAGEKQPPPPPAQQKPAAPPPAQPPPAKPAPQKSPPDSQAQAKPIDKAQVNRINVLFNIAVDELKIWSRADVNARLKAACGKEDPLALTSAQADNIIAAVSEMLTKRGVELPKP